MRGKVEWERADGRMLGSQVIMAEVVRDAAESPGLGSLTPTALARSAFTLQQQLHTRIMAASIR